MSFRAVSLIVTARNNNEKLNFNSKQLLIKSALFQKLQRHP